MTCITTLKEADLREQFSHASGPGGQNVNKVATRVTLCHLPTNISVTVQDSRSQARNRELARERLLAAIESRRRQDLAEIRQRMEKRRRSRAGRPTGVKRRILENKRKRSQLKQNRKRVDAP